MNRQACQRETMSAMYERPNDAVHPASCHPCAGRGPGNMRKSLDSRLRANDNRADYVRSDVPESVECRLDFHARVVVFLKGAGLCRGRMS